MSEHRCLSIRQPWAYLYLTTKKVENRTWPTGYRGPLCIHAGLRVDPRGYEVAAALGVELPERLPAGAFVGHVTLVDVHTDQGCCAPYGERGAYHWVGRDKVLLAEPVPAKGRLGLWRTPAGTATG